MAGPADLGSDGGDHHQPDAPAAMAMKLHSDRLRRMRGMTKLLAALGAAEGLTRYVGGAVRDKLLGLAVADRDHVVVGATADDML